MVELSNRGRATVATTSCARTLSRHSQIGTLSKAGDGTDSNTRFKVSRSLRSIANQNAVLQKKQSLSPSHPGLTAHRANQFATTNVKLVLEAPTSRLAGGPFCPQHYTCYFDRTLRRKFQNLLDSQIPGGRSDGDPVFSRIGPPVTGCRVEAGKG